MGLKGKGMKEFSCVRCHPDVTEIDPDLIGYTCELCNQVCCFYCRRWIFMTCIRHHEAGKAGGFFCPPCVLKAPYPPEEESIDWW